MIGRWTLLAAFAVALDGAVLVGLEDRVAHADVLAGRIEELFRTVPGSPVAYGIAVVDLATGSVVFQRNATQPLIPASNQKLLVIAAAIGTLGPDFEFRTVVGLRGSDLVVVGDGDPAIGDVRLCERSGKAVTAVFDRWAGVLKSGGHETIEGDLVIDDSIFDGQATHPTWDEDELQKWYACPVGGLNFSDNCIELTVWPAKPPHPPFWAVTPPISTIEIMNRAVSATRGVPLIARPGASFSYLLSGRCGARVALEPVSVPDPGMFFADACRTALKRAGIAIRGGTRRERIRKNNGALPADFIALAEHRTAIADILDRIGKNSQNLFAESLAKRVGFKHMRLNSHGPARGSWVSAAAAINSFLASCHVDTTGLIIADASGLSRENRATVSQFAGVLACMYNHPGRTLFVNSLAVAGADGSLRERMRDLGTSIAGKTGTLRGVSALSGYVGGSDAPRFAFSVIFNGFTGPATPYRTIQDDLCRILSSHTGPPHK